MLEAMPVQKLPAEGRAIVRVLPQPLYDTEVLTTAATSNIPFFTKGLGSADQSAVITKKTYGETNVKQAAQLPKPQVFDLLGFNLKVTTQTAGTPVLIADFDKVWLTGWMEFTMGDRVYLRVPIKELPAGNDVVVGGNTTADTKAEFVNGVQHRSNMYRFTIGKYRAVLRWSETWGVTLNWGTAPTVGVNVRLQVLMQGILRNAM